MSEPLITTLSSLQCPHGGQVNIVSANTLAKAVGQIALVNDQFTILGCPFQLPTPVPVPSPCVTVMWTTPDMATRVGGVPTVSKGSVGLCIGATGAPQGPVQFMGGQLAAKST